MKLIAVILYEGYCLCEITVALEMLRMADIPVTYFGVEKKAYRSEEGIVLQCEHTLDELDVDDYDGILLSGFMEENPTILKNELLKEKLRIFDQQKKVIGAISIAPLLLYNAGILKDRPFMCAMNKQDLVEEGYALSCLQNMIDWDACCAEEDLKFIRHEHIITSVIYGFREWAMEIGRMLDIPVYPKSFGL